MIDKLLWRCLEIFLFKPLDWIQTGYFFFRKNKIEMLGSGIFFGALFLIIWGIIKEIRDKNMDNTRYIVNKTYEYVPYVHEPTVGMSIVVALIIYFIISIFIIMIWYSIVYDRDERWSYISTWSIIKTYFFFSWAGAIITTFLWYLVNRGTLI